MIFGITIILKINLKVIETQYQLNKYLNKIVPYLKHIINNLKKSESWKIQLTKTINFISSKDNGEDNEEEHVMHSKSDKKEIMINDKEDEVVQHLFLNCSLIDIKRIWKNWWKE